MADGPATTVEHDAGGRRADRPMLIAISARALLDLREETAFLRTHSLDEYRERQLSMMDERLRPGVAFTFVKRMLALNEIAREGEGKLVEVVIASHMDPYTGMRVTNSVYELGLPVRMALFTSGRSLVQPLSRMGGTARPSHTSGRVYWGYSSRPFQ